MKCAFSASLPLLACILACGGSKGAPAPSITQFTASPAILDIGAPTTLSALFNNGIGQVDPGALPVTSGQPISVSPVATTTYTLSITGVDGTKVSSQTTVNVNPGLLVTIQGLPSGVQAAVNVDGPGGYHQTLTATQALKGLKAGIYTVSADTVMEGPISHYPAIPSQTMVVQDTGVQTVVDYPSPTMSLSLPGNVALDFVLIPAGSFMMGNDKYPTYGGLDVTFPVHHVDVRQAFYLGKFPVTQEQCQAIMGSLIRPQSSPGPHKPLDSVAWDDIRFAILPALGAKLPGYAFRLPSEAEWEYACRAGSTTDYWWGDDASQVGNFIWYVGNVEGGYAGDHPDVGLKPANAWGVYDMVGTIIQWVEDDAIDYTSAPTDSSPKIRNPRANTRMYRGCDKNYEKWNSPYLVTPNWTSAFRTDAWPFQYSYQFGFRIAMDVPGVQP